jgi:hypothetical protein
MIISAILALFASHEQVPQSEAPYLPSDLRGEISYFDESTGYFLEIEPKEHKYLLGYVISRAQGRDQPVVRGDVLNCSDNAKGCIEVGPYVFVRPEKGSARSQYLGYNVVEIKAPNGERAFEVTCERLLPRGCEKDPNEPPQLKYTYSVNHNSEITRIIIDWCLKGKNTVYDLKIVGTRKLKI